GNPAETDPVPSGDPGPGRADSRCHPGGDFPAAHSPEEARRRPRPGAKRLMSLVTDRHADELREGAAELGVALDAHQHEQLLAYLALLIKWNKAYNLTAVRNPDEMVSRHLLDSLSIVPSVAPLGERW